MAAIKSYSDLEQSKKLAEILPIESSDMVYTMTNGYHTPFIRIETIQEMDKDDVCAWSLAALLNTLKLFTTPTAFSVKVCVPLLTKTNNGYSLTYTGDYTLFDKNNFDIAAPIETVADNPVDACYEMILKLKENKLI